MNRYLLPLVAVAVATACSSEPNASRPQDACTAGKCDDSARIDLLDELESRNDAIASFLRRVAQSDGTVAQDYRGFVDGVGAELGCDSASEKTFTILMSKNGYFPRNITTRCSDDPTTASQFFISTQSDYGDLADIELRDFKLFAWDSIASRYNTYEVKGGAAGGPLFVDVEPAHCTTCHTQALDLRDGDIAFTPIMNELTNPWTLWNAEPDFASHHFDELMDPDVAAAPNYAGMVDGQRLGSAADFEILIRSALDRVVNARLRVRRDPPDVEKALGLLRPMFCDETLNYASERHDSGEVTTAVIIDDAVRYMYLAIRPDNWPYAWLNDGRMRLSSLAAGQAPLDVMPVRGEATLQVEVGLVARRALSPEQVLAVRALDWRRPVMSEFRCGLYTKGAERVRANPPNLEQYSNVGGLLAPVYAELMRYEGANGPVSLVPPAGSVYAIADADEARGALADDGAEQFRVSLEGFAELLQTWFDAARDPAQRATLERARQERACAARRQHAAAPDVPGVDCTAAAD